MTDVVAVAHCQLLALVSRQADGLVYIRSERTLVATLTQQ